jgi:hypothetical protein
MLLFGTEVRYMRRHLVALAVALAALLWPSVAGAIVYGEPDGTDHPNVGALIAEWREEGVKEVLCSGTLIAPKVFLTAAHCTAFLESLEIPNDEVWVSFDEVVGDPVGAEVTLFQGEWVTNPEFFTAAQNDPKDLAVVLFPSKIRGIEPADLPTKGLFDQMAERNGLRGQLFTAVGYGVHEPEVGDGPPTFPFDGRRWKAVSKFNALNDAWLRLSQNDATSDGGTCFGDSGGPNFLGAERTADETDIIASITVTGDAMCLATNDTYRLDIESARRFLGQYVDLP